MISTFSFPNLCFASTQQSTIDDRLDWAANMKIFVVGLGYVGLPLAIQFARANVTVLGLDVDPAKGDLINQGKSYIRHIPQATILNVVQE
jgi:UDP-N-acetyl-D-mannosaminuronate dehydrogenase